MKSLSLLLAGVFVLLLGLSYGCDNDNNSNAKSPGGIEDPGPAPAGCPCFTMDDVMNMSKNAVAVSCENTVCGLLFIFESETASPEVFAQCASDGTNCACYGPTTDNKVTDVSIDEASRCMHIMINSLVEFGSNGIEVAGCTFVPVTN